MSTNATNIETNKTRQQSATAGALPNQLIAVLASTRRHAYYHARRRPRRPGPTTGLKTQQSNNGKDEQVHSNNTKVPVMA